MLNTHWKLIAIVAALGLAGAPATAFAAGEGEDTEDWEVSSDEDRPDDYESTKPQDDDTTDSLGKPDEDPQPDPPAPELAEGEQSVTEDAGVGGTIAYAEAGVLELGGSAGFSAAGELTTAELNPSFGWFFADNFEVSAILGAKYADTQGSDAALFSALVEPSVHLPITDTFFGFAGVGTGVQYAEGAGTGFALVPRLGANFLIGRSGIFTPAVNLGYSTVEADNTANGTLLTVRPSVGVTAGYTVMW